MNIKPGDFAAILEKLQDGVYFVDPERRICYWNQAAERISGYSRERMIGQFCQQNLLMHVDQHGEQLCLGPCPLALTLLDGQQREAEVYLHHADGHRVSVAVRVLPLFEDGKITGAVEIFTENDSLATAMARIDELQRAALRDPLTGVGNRRMLHLRMDLAWKEWQRRGLPFGLALIDVDHFKQVNDRLGHKMGDQALQMVARTLAGGLRAMDYVGRWGGEEFLAVISSENEAALEEVGERLRMLVERSIIFLDEDDRRVENSLRVTVSVGLAQIFPGETIDALLARADRALYHAKAAGRNRAVLDPARPAENNPPPENEQ